MTEGPTPRDTPDTTPTTPLSDEELAGGRATIGRYRIERVLGRGGMGIVVAAHDPELDRRVAVKILVDHARSPEALGAALRREAQALARVTHTNVLSVFDAGVDGSPYLVMQLVEGETLGAHLARVKPPVREVIGLFLQAARGLAAIHAAGLIHRDFKPSNALVDTAGVVWVADLGLARIGELALTSEAPSSGSPTQTRTRGIAGTPAYMAPEQFDRIDLTAACDQFSFCVALWEAVLGERPFRGESDDELANNVHGNAPRDSSPGGFTKRQFQAVQRGLSADPAQRFPSMSALSAALTPPSRAPWLISGGVVAATGATIAAVLATGGRSAPSIDAGVVAAKVPAFELSDARRLTITDACDEYPSVAPDGTIYYDLVVGADQHLMAFDPKTRQSRELTTTKGWDLAAQVSPDGKRIVFLRKTEEAMAAHVANLDDLATAKKLVPGGFRPSWSPDGKFIWAGGRKGLTRFDAVTGSPGRKLELPKGAFPMAAIELPDQRVVVLTKTGMATADGVAIYDAGATTSRWLLPASDDNPMDEVLTLAPSGEGVLVARYTVTQTIEIWNLPLDGSKPSVVTTAIEAHKRLVASQQRLVWSDCTEYSTIASIGLLANGATKFVDLARNKWMDVFPLAVPASNDVILLSYRSTNSEIWRMSRGGENPRTVPFGGLELDRISALSHDGALIAAANGTGLFIGPTDGQAKPRMLVPAVEGSELNATFTRDNRSLIFESKDGDKDRVASIPVAGGAPAWVLPAPSTAPAQSPVSDHLAYLMEAPDGKALERIVMVLDQKTGTSRRVSAALPAYPYRDLRWSPDGKRLLAARRDGQLVELEVATGKVLRTFDVGSDQLFGETYAGDDEILVGRSTSAGDIWEAELKP